MDKNVKGILLGIVLSIFGTICIVLAYYSEIIANCMAHKGACPNELLVIPIFILIIIGLGCVIGGGGLLGENFSALGKKDMKGGKE